MSLRPLKEATGNWTPAVDAHGEPLMAIAAAWPRIVGPDVAANSRPLEISGDTLLVLTRSSAWSQQLSFLSERIVAAVHEFATRASIVKVRFRVGRINTATPRHIARSKRSARAQAVESRPQGETLEEVLESFRAGVTAAQRAKAGSGWKECRRCGVPFASRKTICVRCEAEAADATTRAVARLLFEAPWLRYAGVASIVPGLETSDYEAIRLRVLNRWWEILYRAQRAGRISASGRERLIASSYVVLKSGLDPEAITPAVVRNLLGDALHDIIYGKVNSIYS